MAVTTVAPTVLTRDTFSGDLPDASGTLIVTGADGFSITDAAESIGRGRNVLIRFTAVSGTPTVTMTAGDKPPAMRQGLGTISQVFAANDVRTLTVEHGRFIHDDGTYKGTISGDNEIRVAVFVLPIDM